MAKDYLFDHSVFSEDLTVGDMRELHWILEPAMTKTLATLELQSPLDSITLMLNVLAGLEYMHAHGLMHRDIKPLNIGVALDPTKAVILDLGCVVKARENTDHNQGTVRYLAPEVVVLKLKNGKGKPFTNKADIWGVGASFLEYITGSPLLWEHVTPTLYTSKVQHLEKVVAGTEHQMLGRYVADMLSWPPDQRPSATEARKELERWLSQNSQNSQGRTEGKRRKIGLV